MKIVYLMMCLTLSVSCLKNKKALPIGGRIQDSFEIKKETTPELQLRKRHVKSFGFVYYDKNNHEQEVHLSSENSFRDIKRDYVLKQIKRKKDMLLPESFEYAYGLTDFSLEEVLSIKTLKDFTIGEKRGALELELSLLSSDQHLSKIDFSLGYFDETKFVEIYRAHDEIPKLVAKEELALNLNLSELDDEHLRQMLINEESLVFKVNNFFYKRGDKLVSLESERKRLGLEYARIVTSSVVKTEVAYSKETPSIDLEAQVTNILEEEGLLKGESYYLYNVEEEDFKKMKKKSSLLFQGTMIEDSLELPASFEAGEMLVYFNAKRFEESVANRQRTVHVYGTHCKKDDYSPEKRGTICKQQDKGPCTIFEDYKTEREVLASVEDNPFMMRENEDYVFSKLSSNSGKITFTYNAKSSFQLNKKESGLIKRVDLGFTHFGSCMNYAKDQHFAYKDYSPNKVSSDLRVREVYDLIIFHQGLD
jgi:hypothetical protein